MRAANALLRPLVLKQAHAQRGHGRAVLARPRVHSMHTHTHTCRYNVTRAHMDELCENIMGLGYNYILLDCPAGIDVGFINAISPANEALVVTTPEITSIRDAGECQL